jgi:hypothetical protein
MYDCFLSPDGVVYPGLFHDDIADDIIKEVYKIDIYDSSLTEEEFQMYRDSKRFLVERGWMEYINRCDVGWWIHPCKNPTKAQIDAVWELTGDDLTKMWNL